MKNLFKMLISGIIGAGIILLFFYILGMFVAFVESHLFLLIPLGIITIIALIKI